MVPYYVIECEGKKTTKKLPLNKKDVRGKK
jgi:hypothetical protein